MPSPSTANALAIDPNNSTTVYVGTRSNVGVGGGVFNLVRREVYERTPGFSWLKLDVADDVVFGQMMKRAGAR